MAKDEKTAPATKTYILRPGQEHNGFDENGERKLFKGGDAIQLNDIQAKAFADKIDSQEELAIKARVANGGKVSREEALAALGITEEAYATIAPVEETIKQPDPKAGAGDQQKAAGEGLDKEGKDPKEPDHPQKTAAGAVQTTGAQPKK